MYSLLQQSFVTVKRSQVTGVMFVGTIHVGCVDERSDLVDLNERWKKIQKCIGELLVQYFRRNGHLLIQSASFTLKFMMLMTIILSLNFKSKIYSKL